MVRWFSVALALSLVGAPAAAQAQKKPAKAGAKAADKKAPSKPRAEPEPEPEPAPKKKKRVVEEEEEEEAPKPKPKPEPEAQWDSSKSRHGLSLLLGPALSTNNSEGKLTPLPFAALAYSFHGSLGEALYFRLEPGIGYLRRRSTVNVVRRVDASDYPTVRISTEDIVNRVNAIDLSVRALLGYNYSKQFTGRVGLLAGLSTAATDAEACSGDNRSTGPIYGAHLTPIAARFVGAGSAFEIGLSAELRTRKIPRCDVPLKGEFQVNAGEIATFRPKKIEADFATVTVALQGAIFF